MNLHPLIIFQAGERDVGRGRKPAEVQKVAGVVKAKLTYGRGASQATGRGAALQENAVVSLLLQSARRGQPGNPTAYDDGCSWMLRIHMKRSSW